MPAVAFAGPLGDERRAIARTSSTGAAGGTRATNGMRAAYSRSAIAAVRAVVDRCMGAPANCLIARGLATITSMPRARTMQRERYV